VKVSKKKLDKRNYKFLQTEKNAILKNNIKELAMFILLKIQINGIAYVEQRNNCRLFQKLTAFANLFLRFKTN
jgi:hypothetical protein